MVSHHHAKKYLYQHVQCHTCFGTFHGVIIRCTKHHIVLGSIGFDRVPIVDDELRPYPMGGPMGPGGGHGWGGGGGGPMGPGGGHGWGGGGGGPGWGIAVPLAAILGITAVGMHWW